MSELPPTFRLGLIQTHADEDPGSNVERTCDLIAQAAGQGAEIICTQELFASRYFPQTEDDAHFALAHEVPGPITATLADLAEEHGVVIVSSEFEKRAPGVFHNTCVVITAEGGFGGKYRKMHIPDDPRFYEKYYFTPGDLGFQTISTVQARLGVLICWDQWFPEAARLTAMGGAEVLLYPTAIGTWTGESELAASQHAAWQTMQRSHAIANGTYVAAINRVGREGEIDFWGRSFVAAPDGTILAEAGSDEEVLVVECERAAIDRAREGWPFFRDRRIDAYDDLRLRWRE